MIKKLLIASIFIFTLQTFSKTVYTGETLDTYPVIEKLDLTDLAPGKQYRFYFKGVQHGMGQSWMVPLVVFKGQSEGPRFGLQAGVHGDELNGFSTLHKLFTKLDASKLKGSVIALLGANATGLLAHNRHWQIANDGAGMIDFNRIWPGKEKGDAAEVQVFKIWNHLWKDNVDLFIDLHTQSRGTAFPLFVYADYRHAKVRKMAELIGADQIKMDPGEKGTCELVFIEKNIPAITLEIGEPVIFQPQLAERAVQGILNIMADRGMIEGQPVLDPQIKTFVGNDMISVRAELGGLTDYFVKIGDDVKKDQPLGQQRNPFGDIVKTYLAPVDGKILSVGTDPLREPRGLIARILFKNPSPKCAKGC